MQSASVLAKGFLMVPEPMEAAECLSEIYLRPTEKRENSGASGDQVHLGQTTGILCGGVNRLTDDDLYQAKLYEFREYDRQTIACSSRSDKRHDGFFLGKEKALAGIKVATLWQQLRLLMDLASAGI